jgi:hypothetical protein
MSKNSKGMTKMNRRLKLFVQTAFVFCSVHGVSIASPVPDFMASPTAPKVPATSVPVQVPSTDQQAQRPSAADLSGIPDINMSGGGLIPGAPAGTETKMDNMGSVEEFHGPTKTDTKFLDDLIRLRERVILDTLKQRASNIEKTLSSFEALPPNLMDRKPVVKKKIVKAAKPAEQPVKVLGIHEDRAFVSFEGHTKWITVGGTVGPYILKSVTDKEALFGDKKGRVIKVAKAARVIPRPSIVVQSVDNQTATIKYNGATYTVTLASPIGTDLTVTALSNTDFTVTDAHGRAFTYPVPQKAVAPNPGQGPFGYQPPPPPPGFGQQGGQPNATSAEDNSY